ncbi:MAG TPA: phosphoribosylamine--glycine ligase [Candidatus Nanoarchaeia archaeon]|nr:phosphoribosylamine--glycine ligase [Candidatus Nanoarchaeia archaeon]
MNVLLIGNGAREHAMAEAIIRSPKKPKLYSYMKANNPGIASLSYQVKLGKYDDLSTITSYAKASKIDIAVIGPEDPLSDGVVDALEKEGIKAVGPKKQLAQLETSKSFTRNLMKKYNVPGAPIFGVFNSTKGLKEFLIDLHPKIVLKPDGLTAGKGVKVQGDHFTTVEEAYQYCEEVLKSHSAVVVEEKLEGEEFSLQSFTDGFSLLHCHPVQDHKRAFAGDKGPNTGGMGSYSTGELLPFMEKSDLEQAKEITDKMREALKKECGEPYKGVMYGGFICTKEGTKLIEYNARLGDPEAMNVLPIMNNDYVDVLQAIADGTLSKIKADFRNISTVCKYAVPNGYPDHPVENQKVSLDNVPKNVKVYYASIDKREDGLYMSKSRALAFVGIAKDIEEAQNIAEEGVKAAKGPIFHREDIGTKNLIDKRIKHMQRLRQKSN